MQGNNSRTQMSNSKTKFDDHENFNNGEGRSKGKKSGNQQLKNSRIKNFEMKRSYK